VQAVEIWVDKTIHYLHCEYMTRSFPFAKASVSSVQRSVRGCPRRCCSAFTLIEILLVVAVIAVLAGLTLASLGGINQKAARDRTKAEISAIANALESYRSQNGTYPESVGTNSYVPMTNIGGFLAVEKMQVVDNVPYDPFGQPYLYRFPGKINRASFDVYSIGAAKSELDTNGWIGNW
jgi:general secretion pathway protein G